MTTAHVSSRISEEQYNQIIISEENVSEFIKKAIQERLNSVSLDSINKKIKEHKEKIEILENRKKLFKQKESQKKNIPKEELTWFSETNKILKNNPEFFEGRYNQYLNIFPKSYSFTKQDFKAILDEVSTQIQ